MKKPTNKQIKKYSRMLIRPIKKPTDREIRKYAHMIIEQAKYDTIILSQIFA